MIVLLGGSGFLGKYLIKELQRNNLNFKTMIHKNDVVDKIKKFRGSVDSNNYLLENISEDDIVINLTGQIDLEDPDFLSNNLRRTLNILNACKEKKVKQVIIISSINVYGSRSDASAKETDYLNPETRYGLAKQNTEEICEQYSKEFELNIVVLRLSLLYGIGQTSGLMGNIQKSVNSNTTITISHNGEQYRDFLFVEDAAKSIIHVIKIPQEGFSIFNISSGKAHKINTVVKIIEKIIRKKIKVNYSSLALDEKYICADNLKAKKILNFQINTDFKTGLELIFSK